MESTKSFSEILEKLLSGRELNEEESQFAEDMISQQLITPGQIGAYSLAKEKDWNILEFLCNSPSKVEGLINSLPADIYKLRPRDDHWSISEVVGHLADNEMVNAIRVRYILTEDAPEMIGYDSDIWDRFINIDDIHTSLRRWKDLRTNLIKLAQGLNKEDWKREGYLSYRGTESLLNLLGVLAGHDHRHILQIERIVKMLKEKNHIPY
ncbi:hypothetical protein ABIC37_005859 [Priestia megaterium]|uniref:DinB family protein n=1 Tax=Priestia megaterium TaxID=1404 RepID=UPI000BF96467|nr:DinB family protein [Priestia megaterium]MCM3185910.1 DinB family protein [Priestia megaterium]PFK99289.1 hypothetical protein COJ01_20080 [Priestia megaterium]RCX19552.1 glycosyl transferase family protein with helical bundle domain [Bacillus sp. AG236]